MEFRWVAALSLWTLLSGPVLTQPSHQPPAVPPFPSVRPSAPKADRQRPPAPINSPRR
jgi:hypothetical protein